VPVALDLASPRTVLRRAGAAVRLGWTAAPKAFAGSLALNVLVGAGPVVAAWSTKVLLDELSRGRSAATAPIVGAIVLIAAAGIGQAVAGAVGSYLHVILQRSISVLVQVRLFRRINDYVGLAPFEDPALLDRIRLAEQAGENAPEEAVSAGIQLLAAAVTAIGFIATLLVLWPPMVAVVLFAAIPVTAQQLWLGRMRAALATGISTLQRRQVFFRTLLSDVRAAKETRLFGLGDFLSGRVLRDLRAANAAENAVDRSAARIEALIGLIGGLLGLIGVAIAAYLAVHGKFSIGDVTVFIAAVLGLHMTVGSATASTARAYQALLMFGHYLAVVESPLAATAGREPPALRDAIEFNDVWFRYGDHLPWVLRGATFRLPAGQTVGLVGLNGAGKSTVVKLLTRLYEPQRGHITWDGTDLAELDPARLRQRMSVVFQDFMAYDFSASDNIAVGDLAALDDRERVTRAAVRADADGIVAGLPRGYDTLLSRIFSSDEDGGQNATLSGGQWQRLALARAFLREDADVLLLDEPSSGQDAQAEDALHRRLSHLRRSRLSLVISHRLNAFRGADRIVVLDRGVVVEQGSHEHLIRAKGRYAELFSLQAAGYQLVSDLDG
jgi:ATP-binding cassette subfamily B protein